MVNDNGKNGMKTILVLKISTTICTIAINSEVHSQNPHTLALNQSRAKWSAEKFELSHNFELTVFDLTMSNL